MAPREGARAMAAFDAESLLRGGELRPRAPDVPSSDDVGRRVFAFELRAPLPRALRLLGARNELVCAGSEATLGAQHASDQPTLAGVLERSLQCASQDLARLATLDVLE